MNPQRVPCPRSSRSSDSRVAGREEDFPVFLQEIQRACRTIRTAMRQCNELYNDNDNNNLHSVVRWIQTKEKQASKIITLVLEYCFCSPNNNEEPTNHALQVYHTILQLAMKTKQTVKESPICEELDQAVLELVRLYSTQPNTEEIMEDTKQILSNL